MLLLGVVLKVSFHNKFVFTGLVGRSCHFDVKACVESRRLNLQAPRVLQVMRAACRLDNLSNKVQTIVEEDSIVTSGSFD